MNIVIIVATGLRTLLIIILLYDQCTVKVLNIYLMVCMVVSKLKLIAMHACVSATAFQLRLRKFSKLCNMQHNQQ